MGQLSAFVNKVYWRSPVVTLASLSVAPFVSPHGLEQNYTGDQMACSFIKKFAYPWLDTRTIGRNYQNGFSFYAQRLSVSKKLTSNTAVKDRSPLFSTV
jgi:hypothetical protein